jgi:ATP synthase protein I
MTTDTGSTAAAEQARATAVRELRFRAGVTLAAMGVCVVVSVLTAGAEGLWGGLVGVVLVLGFFGASAWVMTRTRTLEPAMVLVIAMGLYLLKVVALAVAIILLSVFDLLGDPLHRTALAVTIIVGALTWSATEVITAVRRREPIFDVGRDAS